MFKIAEVQFNIWDKKNDCQVNNQDIKSGDFVVVKTKNGTDFGKAMKIKESEKEDLELDLVLRKATDEDCQKIDSLNANNKEVLEKCREVISKHNLNMKLIDVRISLDGGHMVFAFAAEGRIDFRDLVKDLTKIFKKSIRLHQVGIRDEMKITGDIGACGKELCCKKFLKDLKSVTSDLAELQQVSHRGSERISGVCGRLRCCLAYEQNGYEELAKKLPPIGSIINTPQGKGEVIGWHTLKQSVDVVLVENEAITEVPLANIRR